MVHQASGAADATSVVTVTQCNLNPHSYPGSHLRDKILGTSRAATTTLVAMLPKIFFPSSQGRRGKHASYHYIQTVTMWCLVNHQQHNE